MKGYCSGRGDEEGTGQDASVGWKPPGHVRNRRRRERSGEPDKSGKLQRGPRSLGEIDGFLIMNHAGERTPAGRRARRPNWAIRARARRFLVGNGGTFVERSQRSADYGAGNSCTRKCWGSGRERGVDVLFSRLQTRLPSHCATTSRFKMSYFCSESCARMS